jgi:hypothetical protein
VQCFAKACLSLTQAGSTRFSDKPSDFTCFEDRISLFLIIKFPVSEKLGIKG